MFYTILLIILAILPVVLICYFIYDKDIHKENPKKILLLFILGLIAGMLVIPISVLLEYLIPTFRIDISDMNMIQLALKTFIEIALIEEFCKWIMTYLAGYKSDTFTETYDIIIYTVFVAMGFATFENMLYILDSNSISVAISRAIFSIPAHTSYAIFMSYYLCKAKLFEITDKPINKTINILKSLLIPILFHGIFDFCLFTGKTIFIIIFIAFVILLFLLAFERLRRLYLDNIEIEDEEIVNDLYFDDIEGKF